MQASMLFLYTFKGMFALKLHDAIFAFKMQNINKLNSNRRGFTHELESSSSSKKG